MPDRLLQAEHRRVRQYLRAGQMRRHERGLRPLSPGCERHELRRVPCVSERQLQCGQRRRLLGPERELRAVLGWRVSGLHVPLQHDVL